VSDVRVDRTTSFDVDAPPAQLWAVLADTSAYVTWWPWLESADLPSLCDGAHAEVVVHPPLPYRLRLELEVVEVIPERRVTVVVAGDLGGRAQLELVPAGAGSTTVRLDFALVVQRPGLKRIPGAAAPVLLAGHRIVLAQGLAQFLRATGLSSPSASRARRRVGRRVLVGATALLGCSALVLVRRRGRHAPSGGEV